jgi:hypothetical protein
MNIVPIARTSMEKESVLIHAVLPTGNTVEGDGPIDENKDDDSWTPDRGGLLGR